MTTSESTTPVPGSDLRDCIVDINGWLFLASPSIYYDEPKVGYYFYPLGFRTHDFHRNYGRDLPLNVDAESTGQYRESEPPSRLYDHAIKFRLVDGGKTVATYWFECQVPIPKVRAGIEVQFRNGRWQKYLKSQGWVAA